jgi:hypothetical protein
MQNQYKPSNKSNMLANSLNKTFNNTLKVFDTSEK